MLLQNQFYLILGVAKETRQPALLYICKKSLGNGIRATGFENVMHVMGVWHGIDESLV